MFWTPAPALNDPANWSTGVAPPAGDAAAFGNRVVFIDPGFIDQRPTHSPGSEAGDEVVPDAIVDEPEPDV